MMEGDGGASLLEQLVEMENAKSVFRAYAFPYMTTELTVLTHAMVTRVTFEGSGQQEWRFSHGSKTIVSSGTEVGCRAIS